MARGLLSKTYQYDFDGNFVAEYNSTSEAAFAVNGFSGSNIANILLNKKGCRTYKGFIWSDKYYLKIPKKILIETISYTSEKYMKPIYQYNLKGKLIAAYDNLNHASIDLDIPSVTIRRSLNNPGNSGAKHFWSFTKYKEYPQEYINNYVRHVIEKPFYHYDINGKFVKKYDSIDEIKGKIKKSQVKLILRGLHDYNSDGFWSYTKYKKYPEELIVFNGSKVVIQYDLKGKKIKEYKSTVEAAKHVGAFPCNISQVCNGKNKTAKGFIWRYKTNPL